MFTLCRYLTKQIPSTITEKGWVSRDDWNDDLCGKDEGMSYITLLVTYC